VGTTNEHDAAIGAKYVMRVPAAAWNRKRYQAASPSEPMVLPAVTQVAKLQLFVKLCPTM